MVDLARIGSAVQIDNVRLSEGQFRSFADPSSVAEELAAKSSHDAFVTRDPGDDARFLISVRFQLQIRETTGEEELQAEISAAFDLSYRLPTEDPFSAEEIEGFGQLHAVFNAWPYWREFVQTSLSRMALPSLTLPLYRMPQGQTPIEEN
jgi:hypothetical protein